MLVALLETLAVIACVAGLLIFIFFKDKERQRRERCAFDDPAKESDAKADQEIKATFCGYCGSFNSGKADVCYHCGAILNKEHKLNNCSLKSHLRR